MDRPYLPVQGLGERLVTVVSDEDYEMAQAFSWSLAGGKGSRGKYAATRVQLDGRPQTHYLHRLVAWRMGLIEHIVGEEAGNWTTSVDHANGDKLDNRRENLRLLDRQQQMRNPNDGLRTTNRSGHRGVSFVQSRERFGKPWMAYVGVNNKTINLGWYATVEEAAEARGAWDDRNAIEA